MKDDDGAAAPRTPHHGAAARPEGPDGPVIDVRGLYMRYGGHQVLHGVDFSVRRGEVVALLGPNGAGKSTTIEILEGFRERSAGAVRVLGTDPAEGDERWRSRLGVVLQSWRDHGKWRVRELLEHFAAFYAPYSTPRHPRPWDTAQLLALVGLTGQAEQRVGSLSGGQRRRLDLAIAVVGRPEVLFLDEPTVGFDPEARQEFHTLVKVLADQGNTILLTTHDLEEAQKLADRVLILVGGRIIAHGTVDELARRIGADVEVTWTTGCTGHRHRTPDVTGFLRRLFEEHGDDVADLRVRQVNLEDVYLAVVRDAEVGRTDEAARRLAGAAL
ncbi:multidrug ABC transporter ATPase [Streptomyces sp. XY58]|nr:multidrug ABC transporter ATPase [Streptomyces sp. XY58]KOV05564.1 multidrug ABC transporter ATPase [Streptomyces sp. XY37]KOV47890.1 multidrug ABC transporter ATPase [Streptomyces sp. MMG1064]